MAKKKNKKLEAPKKSGSRNPYLAFLKKNQTTVGLLLILLLGVVVYSNTFAVPFVFDDLSNILYNPEVRSINDALHAANSSRVVGVLSFALNYRFNNENVTGYHAVNLVIHLANALMVFLFVFITFKTPFFREKLTNESGLKSQALIVALFSALFFVVHPVQTQAVTYVVQRFASLATMFFLLSIFMYARFRLVSEVTEDKVPAHRLSMGPGVRKTVFYAISLASAALAMLTKEIAFTLPVIIALWEFSFFSGGIIKRILRLSPYFLILLLVPLSRILSGFPLLAATGEEGLSSLPSVTEYLFTQFRVLVTYLRLLVIPVAQNLDYDYPLYRSFTEPAVFLSFFFLTAVMAGGVLMYYLSARKRDLAILRLAAFGVFWFFITIAVESSIIPIADLIFEHRLYLPSIGFFLMAVAGVQAVAVTWPGRKGLTSKVAITAMALLVLVSAFMAFERNNIWHDRISLWQDVVEKSPGKARPQTNLGKAYSDNGELEKAQSHLVLALAIKPDYTVAQYVLGANYAMQGKYDEATAWLHKATEIQPDFAEAYYQLGNIHVLQGRFDEAVLEYEEAIRIYPDYKEARNQLEILKRLQSGTR
ncbi:MAG: tetratricopeptide repeat protein [Thermoleophilia bacterium]|nr:tetratricopeptide repeat protein [Thermoleophilia bacterium]